MIVRTRRSQEGRFDKELAKGVRDNRVYKGQANNTKTNETTETGKNTSVTGRQGVTQKGRQSHCEKNNLNNKNKFKL